MSTLHVDFSRTGGSIKPMNAVNNGPTAPGVRLTYTSFDAYKAAEIPFARNHDASFFTGYGGEHTVDVHRIFRDFHADETDPTNYIFEPTDNYLATIQTAGSKVFYRLGASIEHGYKFGTRVPPDFAKWARICEHIIRHYTEGWADGFYYDILYWEIWNEPNCINADGSNPCWQGTPEQFIDFYCTAAKHLKACFPHLKIGGPASLSIWDESFNNAFFQRITENNVPLDFFSYHWYGKNLHDFSETLVKAKAVTDSYGLSNVELILNEWNYVRGWLAEDWKYTLAAEKGNKGASFVVGAMCLGQAGPLDMLMYYDARPCAMNGLFANETYAPLKGYYPFVMFRDLRKLGSYVPTECSIENIYTCAATDGSNAALMLTHYHEDDMTPRRQSLSRYSN